MPIITWKNGEWEVLFPMTQKRKWFDGELSAERVAEIATMEWKKELENR